SGSPRSYWQGMTPLAQPQQSKRQNEAREVHRILENELIDPWGDLGLAWLEDRRQVAAGDPPRINDYAPKGYVDAIGLPGVYFDGEVQNAPAINNPITVSIVGYGAIKNRMDGQGTKRKGAPEVFQFIKGKDAAKLFPGSYYALRGRAADQFR